MTAEPRLVLWDIDQTLIEAAEVSRRAYAAAFRTITGCPLDRPWAFDGRTELAAVTAVLRDHGLEPEPVLVNTFVELIVTELTARADELAAEGRVLPGAAEALAAVHAVPGIHQSVLTGNVFPLAVLKLAVFGLDAHLDSRLGAYGGDAFERTSLPGHALKRAERHLGRRFHGPDTIIIGDTVRDVQAAQAIGARAIAVATGPASVSELRAAGADIVLPDLTSTSTVLRAIRGS